MSLSQKDVTATLLTALVVLAFFATHEGWNVWLIGDSHRWAAGTIFVLGGLTCALGSRSRGAMSRVLAVLGATALALAILAVATGSLTPLFLLVVDIVLLWALSTLRHTVHVRGQPHAA
jgi:peptidoglycan/LPS O-acetylase OafA/YrhL